MNLKELVDFLMMDHNYLAIKNSNKSIGLVTGVFDLLHQGHLDFLKRANIRMGSLGGYLLIGVETDIRVKKLKGEDRPIENEEIRVQKLRKTGLADMVFLLPEDFSSQQVRADFLRMIKPTLLLVSASTPNLKKKKELVAEAGGSVEIIAQHNPKYSTSQIIMKARQLFHLRGE